MGTQSISTYGVWIKTILKLEGFDYKFQSYGYQFESDIKVEGLLCIFPQFDF